MNTVIRTASGSRDEYRRFRDRHGRRYLDGDCRWFVEEFLAPNLEIISANVELCLILPVMRFVV